MPFPGPDCLGRGIVVRPGQPVPAELAGVPEIRVDSLSPAVRLLNGLHLSWVRRQRVVVRLALAPESLREPQSSAQPPYLLGARFEFERERLAFLVWANNYDATRGPPSWRLAEHAIGRLGARSSGEADIQLLDGTPAWCDGGPRGGMPIPVVHGETMALGRLAFTMPADTRAPAGELADDQRRAVLHSAGAARVIAPAGSGKTRVLAARLRHLLEDRGYEPDTVTAVAYNKRAATELEERVAGLGARVKTLHALGYEILRRRGGAQLVQEREMRQIIGRLVEIAPQRGRDSIAPWLEALAEVRLALREPREVEKARGDAVKGFTDFFPRYRQYLADNGLCDHDEQIYGALERLLASPEERRRVQRQCRHLLVDEFQDLTPAYMLLVRLLAAPAGQVFGVGDDDQVIYGYMGASPSFLIDFSNYFPGATEYSLQRNYRCHPHIVDAASRLLARNRRRVPKTILAGASCEDGGILSTEVPANEMASAVKNAVGQLLEQGGDPRQVAVLCRVNDALLPVQLVLREAGIACTTPIDASLLDRSGVRAAMSWLALVSGPALMVTPLLTETIMRPSRKIRRATADRLEERRAWADRDLLAFCRGLPSWEAEQVRQYLADIQKLRGMAQRGATTSTLLRAVRVQIGLGSDMQTLDESHSDASGSSHLDQLLALEQVAPLHSAPATFEEWVRERLQDRSTRPGVTLSTVHRVKGMEWDFVVIYGATAGLMPHRLSDDVEEERRVFHVAMTRARRAAIVLAERERPSPFIAQMRGAERESRERPKKKKANRAGQADALRAEVGLQIQSPHRGTVCAVEAHHVLLQLETGGKLRLSYGERVTCGGRRVRLARPGS